jgi:uncharacterized protein (TIGR00661 family)
MSKYLFLVQGEGKGHLTQAITLSQLLRGEGHTVSVLVGSAKDRAIPVFFKEQIGTDIEQFVSPQFIFEKDGSLNFLKNILYHIPFTLRYFRSVKAINQSVKAYQPDVIVNFYELLCGLYSIVYRPKTPIVCIGHHYLMFHSDFIFPKGHWLDRQLLHLSTRFTAARASKLLALSFRAMPNQSQNRIVVTPPLIRQEVGQLTISVAPFWLVYVNYPHLMASIINWHEANPSVQLHCFCNHTYPDSVHQYDGTLVFHQLDGTKFLMMMARCQALVTTAGFESVCEAMYLGKPTMMVPVHFEQNCNALDAERAGAGIGAPHFDLSILQQYLPKHNYSASQEFRSWYNNGNKLILRELEAMIG